jgi:transposase
MARRSNHPQELMDRGVRLAMEAGQVDRDLGIGHEALSKRVRRAEADGGLRPDLPSSEEGEEIKRPGARTSSCVALMRSRRASRCFSRPSSMQTVPK